MLKWRTPRGPQLRHCAKVALAAVAAYLLTLGDRNDFALYSMLGAALVVGGSVGEDLNASLNRVRGTLAGTLVAITLAYAFGLSIWSLGISVALLAWLCIGLGWGAAAMRVGIAMALVVLFAHSADAAHYGWWRLLNTLVGVTIGMAVSRLVWPIRGRDEIAAAIDRALAATAALLEALAGGAAAAAPMPQQTQLLDALSALRTARKNAQIAQQIDSGTDMLTAPTLNIARIGIAALGASVKLDGLVHTGVRPECVQAVQQAIVPLAAHARDRTLSADDSDFASLHENARREAAHPDNDPDARALLAGVLAELQQIRAALEGVRDSARS